MLQYPTPTISATQDRQIAQETFKGANLICVLDVWRLDSVEFRDASTVARQYLLGEDVIIVYLIKDIREGYSYFYVIFGKSSINTSEQYR